MSPAEAILAAGAAVTQACDALDDTVRPLLPEGWDVEITPEIDEDEDIFWLRLVRPKGRRTTWWRVLPRNGEVYIGDAALADWVARAVAGG